MPIDTFEPVYSAARGRVEVVGGQNNYDIATTRFLSALKDLLISCGWTENAYLYATGNILFGFGLPFVSPSDPPPGGKVTVYCNERVPILKFAGASYVGYNPYTEEPGLGGTCVFFPYGTTSAGTFSSLASAINEGPYNASVSGNNIVVTAKNPGASWNFPQSIPDGRWGTPGAIQEGGYSLSSPGPATNIIAAIKATGGNHDIIGPIDGFIRVKITSGDVGGESTWDTFVHDLYAPIKTIVILACAHGFCYFDPDSDTHFLRYTSFLIQAINIPPGFFDCEALFMVGAGQFRLKTTLWSTCACALEGGINTWTDGAAPRPVFVRSPGTTALKTLSGIPYLHGCYVGFGRFREDTAQVVGRMYECIMTTDYVAPGGKSIQGNMKYEVVSSQIGANYETRCSILWRYK